MITDQLTHCPICQTEMVITAREYDTHFGCPIDSYHLWAWYLNRDLSKGFSAINIRYDKYQILWSLEAGFTRIWEYGFVSNSSVTNPLLELKFLMDIPRDQASLEQRLKTLLTFM